MTSGGLEVLPARTVSYRGGSFDELDVAAVLDRRPDLALVDELAHANVPGERHAKRWQDVGELLARGIDVYTTLNVTNIEWV
jgi:two-component system sensor histidine kinase KdpD